MRILRRIEGSVLWLFEDNPIAAANLQAEAKARGVEGRRLVFARPMPVAEHIAAPQERRFVSRHLSLQRPYDRHRRPLDGRARRHADRDDLPGARRRKRAEGDRRAGTDHGQRRGLRGPRYGIGDRSARGSPPSSASSPTIARARPCSTSPAPRKISKPPMRRCTRGAFKVFPRMTSAQRRDRPQRASITTKACASGCSSVMVRWMNASRAGRRDGGEPRRRAAGQPHRRLAAGQIDDAHVAPEHAAAQPRAQRLGAGLLGGEALGVGGGAPGAPLRAAPLDVGEAARDEALAEALERLLDAADVAEVAADADDHRLPPRARPSSIAARIAARSRRGRRRSPRRSGNGRC